MIGKFVKRIHIVGIGGISLSALATMLAKKHYKVSGSDCQESEVTKRLECIGIKVYIGHNAKNITPDIDLVVFSAAVHEDNPEILQAKKLGIKIITRAELLGLISSDYNCVISVAGTHGKTTTTGILSDIFLNAGLNPSIHIGGEYDKIGGNVRAGGDKYFITEACEYVDSFLSLTNNYAIILNIQKDHTDYFKNMMHLFSSFNQFANNTRENGYVVLNNDDDNCTKIKAKCKIISYGVLNNADVVARNIVQLPNKKYKFDCYYLGEFYESFELGVYGRHNIYNALASICVSIKENIDKDVIKQSLLEFSGVDRRFQKVGELCGAHVIHDYAHHPSEIKASIETAKSIFDGDIYVVFQPHTYSRTQSLYAEFCNCFIGAKETVLYPIYPARELPLPGITSKKLSEDLVGTKGKYFESFDEIYRYLQAKVNSRDVVLILGAGNIVEICKCFKNS